MKRSALAPLLVSAGLCGVALASAATAQAATSTTPTPAPTPAPTAAPTTNAPTSTTIQQTTTTEVPYYKIVRDDCSDYTDDETLADELDAAKGSDGSGHLVTLARYCGVLFSDKAKEDPDLKRPASNLEYAVGSGDDPFFTTQNDVVTANDKQTEIVIKASTERWFELHPTTTTAAPTTEASGSTTTSIDTTNPDATTVPSDDSDTDSATTTTKAKSTTSSNDSSAGGNGVEMFGYLVIGAGASAWAVYGVRRPGDAEQPV